MPSPVVDVPGSHSHQGRQAGIKDMITKLCEMHYMCQVLGQHKDRSNELSQEDLQKGPALRADTITGLLVYVKRDGGGEAQGGGTTTGVWVK